MSNLTIKEIQDLDSEVDVGIKDLTFLKQSRNIALLQLLRYFEDFIKILPTNAPLNLSDEAIRIRWKVGQDAMQFAILWIFQHTVSSRIHFPLVFDRKAFEKAAQYHEVALEYSKMWDFMAMLHGQRVISKRTGNLISVSYPGHLKDYVDITPSFFAEVPIPSKTKSIITPPADPRILLKSINVKITASDQIKYVIPDSIFEQIYEFRFRQKESIWELDDKWDLGAGYTVGEFKLFWRAFDTICWIHQEICFRKEIKERIRWSNILKILQRKTWEEELSKRSGLDEKIVTNILEDLIFDFSLYGRGKKLMDPTYQPFFPLSPTLLTVSNQLVYLSNAERNLWDLLSEKRPEIHSDLRNRKENLWIDELKPRLESYGLEIYETLNFNYNGQKSDLDLLVIDRKLNVVMGMQLKWLTEPDRFRDYKYTDEELRKGLDQAELSLKWLQSIPNKLKDLTGLNEAQLKKYEFKGIVVSKNTLASGWLKRKNIPIITDKLLHWVLGKPLNRNLRTLWAIGEERRYLPVEGNHYKKSDIKTQFREIKFVGKDLGILPLKKWDPSLDIDISGLL